MLQIAKLAALVALAAAVWGVVERQPTTTVVVERQSWLPERVVRVTSQEIYYKGVPISVVPVCPDSGCVKVDALLVSLETSQPAVPRGAFEPARLVLVELDPWTDGAVERQVLNTIVAAGYWPVVTYSAG